MIETIETYKILTRKYDAAAVPTLVQACTYVTRDFRKLVSNMMYESIVYVYVY